MAESQDASAESLSNVLTGNVYVTDDHPAPFEVLGIDVDVNGDLWVHTEANDYIESDWFDKRQAGYINRIE